MSVVAPPAAVQDPIGLIVSLVAAASPELEPELARRLVSGLAGGRAKSRRLAAALAARPELLKDGLSPAPRALGELLVALSRLGAASISPPRCASCHKELSSFQRRGEDWFCSVCDANSEPCAACHRLARVTTRDRAGKPRCKACPDLDSRDPVEIILASVRALQPDAERDVVAAAIEKAAASPTAKRRLAWAIEDNPFLLSGEASHAPLRAVLRLIEALHQSGLTAVVLPSCGRCGRTVRIDKPLDGVRVCRSCIAKSRIEACSCCRAEREPAARDGDGRPICSDCLIADPANLERCVNCGRRRSVSTRSAHGPLCGSCPPLRVLRCSICRENAPCGISRLTGKPWCFLCQSREARCLGCGELQAIASGSLERPRCGACTDAAFPDCATCEQRPRPGSCPRCRLEARLTQLLGGPDGRVPPALVPLQQALQGTEPPSTVLHWLERRATSSYLSQIAAGRCELTHAGLDGLLQSPALAHLRAVLVSTGTLMARDEQMARLEHLVEDLIAGRDDPDE
ncbi:MAG TPA: hypothetical protein VMD59_17405, partial [Acidimicrobiales bacterium]|nr:hypothetical protein [Acidimicrobiales bacterium]